MTREDKILDKVIDFLDRKTLKSDSETVGCLIIDLELIRKALKYNHIIKHHSDELQKIANESGMNFCAVFTKKQT